MERIPAKILKQYICNDCMNEFWVDIDMEPEDVNRCPICYVDSEGFYDTDQRIDVSENGVTP